MNLKLNSLILIVFLSNYVLFLNESHGQVFVQRNLDLELAEKDSIKSIALEMSLNAFLTEAKSGIYSNEYVDTFHLKKYQFFFKKLSRIGLNSNDFHKPMILKSFTPDGKSYYITVAFSGVTDSIPFIYQVTELKLIPYKNHYRFYCLFEENTNYYKTKTYGQVTYYYRNYIDEKKATNFAQFKDELSELTETPSSNLDYYAFQSLDELLKAYGFLYSARQCNFLCYDLGFTDNEGQQYMTGTNNENYIFGYLGEYLYYNLPNSENMYWPFVQGVSTYYGGYALSYDDLEELKQQFRTKLKENPDLDFLEEFKKGRKSSVNRHFSYYVMSAFLCEEVLNQKDFKSVLELVYSGRDGQLFFENLKRVLNVDEKDFHDLIVNLIEA